MQKGPRQCVLGPGGPRLAGLQGCDRLVEQGHVDAPRYAQVGLRGYWPGDEEFAWQAGRGITPIFMHEVRDHGIEAAVERVVRR